jgi:1,4-alpha-glucan branching enzyme
MNKNIPKLVKDDSWLEPYAEIILDGLLKQMQKKQNSPVINQLSDFATGYLYFRIA